MRSRIVRWMALRLLWALGIRTWRDAGFQPRNRPPSTDDWRSFEDAFDSHVGSCRGQCACGREFWCSDLNSGFDWEEGEVEELMKNPNATGLEYSVGYVEFEGGTFVIDCDCWRQRADRIRKFIDAHSYEIADYLMNEKRRRAEEADRAPTVDEVR